LLLGVKLVALGGATAFFDIIAFRAVGLLSPPLSIEEFLPDRSVLFWFLSRMMPGSPPVFPTIYDVTIRAAKTAGYLDYAVSMAAQQRPKGI
jgi:hypothetical protein